MAEQKNSLHNLVMENRRRAVISGVKEVEGFTEAEVSLYTDMGQLTVKGKKLHVNQFSTDTGELIMVGDMINSLIYSDKPRRTPNNFMTKLFK
ncbi:MAG: YabP/YqfC family sporulation protein [[Eubacterium] siraeum]|nr:YabP/YqfC family sporulation protein [[Eubacterium] siraeum]